jgi:hypothetical protein
MRSVEGSFGLLRIVRTDFAGSTSFGFHAADVANENWFEVSAKTPREMAEELRAIADWIEP